MGQKVWEYMRDHPDENAAFNRGLAEIRKDEQAAIAAAYDWTGVASVVDVGGGARHRTVEEYDELFAATGFGPSRVVETGTAFSILEARPS